VFHRVPMIPTPYVHVLAGAGDSTLEITAGGPISASVEAAGEATNGFRIVKTGYPESPCAIRRDRSDCPISSPFMTKLGRLSEADAHRVSHAPGASKSTKRS
jgi:hypothetical protein